ARVVAAAGEDPVAANRGGDLPRPAPAPAVRDRDRGHRGGRHHAHDRPGHHAGHDGADGAVLRGIHPGRVAHRTSTTPTTRRRGGMTRRTDFEGTLGFTPDPFQTRAIDALVAGRSVLVAAPTGAGKTVV